MKPLNLICFAILFLVGNSAFAKKPANENNYSLGGYVHTFWKYDFREDKFPNNEFKINRAQLEFETSVSNKIFATIEIGYDKNKLEPKDVFLEYRANSLINLVLGQHKMPFSMEELCPNGKLLVIDRGKMNDAFDGYGYLGRDIGASLKGEILKNKLPIAYTVGIFNGNGCATNEDNNNVKQFAERITVKPFKDYLTIGINSAQKNDSLTGKVITASGADFSCQKSGFTLEGEILSGAIDTARNVVGYYATGFYKFHSIEPGIKFEMVDPDSKTDEDNITTITYAINWYLHPKARLQANLRTHMPAEEESYNVFIIQAQVNF